ncbi:MAG: ASKHA domain-containing protein [Candidatus Aminicenantales bacterium]
MRSEKNKTKRHSVTFLPFEASVEVSAGTTILDALRKASLPLRTFCGGKGTCGECIVRVIRGEYRCSVSAALSEELRQKGYTLACLTKITDNLSVELPHYQQLRIKSVTASLLPEEKEEISGSLELSPLIKTFKLKLPPPTLEDNYSDLKRIQRFLEKKMETKNIECEYSVLKKIAHTVRTNKGNIHGVCLRRDEVTRIIDVEPAFEEKNIYGLACDIGTTTVAIHFVDLKTGAIKATAADYNQQIRCGEDIISRINYSQKPGRLEELHHLVVTTINHILEEGIKAARISHADIYLASVTGNTTMIHLFLNLDPRYIREEPYVPTINQVPFLLARDLGLRMNPEARVYCAPSVGSYVGSDITAGLLCTPILKSPEKISIFIDVGTNGELVVGNRDWLLTCACSAGPAFEGGGIRCGMPASEGAIEKFALNDRNEVEYNVIGGGKPKGLCGSGLIDLLSELFIHGLIDRNGKFKESTLSSRIVETERGKGFLVEEGKNSYWGNDIIFTEKEISTLIRTKGAVFSASSLLMKNAGLTFNQIENFYIGGGFGQHLNIENAIRIGLLPDLKRNSFHYLGNSSLFGAYLILISDKNRVLANEVSEKMTYIELNTEPEYMREYTGALFLPHTDINLFPSVKHLLL